MKFIIYDPGSVMTCNHRRWYGNPVVVYTERQAMKKDGLGKTCLASWPSNYVVLTIYENESGTITEGCVAGFQTNT